MKSLQEIINQPPIFIEDWKECSNDKVAEDFRDDSILKKHILFAYYLYEDWNGDAYVLFEEDGKLFEVFGSHCSCYGLEYQWRPEETTLEAIEYRILNAKGYHIERWHDELRNLLGINKAQ